MESQNQNRERQPTPEVTCFAKTSYRNRSKRFGIKRDDRRRHMYLIGKTGMGKSTLMEGMIINDIQSGKGVALVDPHGDFAEKMLNYVPKHRINDVVYFNPGDLNYPIGFNILESLNDDQKHLVASGLISIFKKLWADSWGPRLEYVLRNAILGLMDYPDSTLLGVMRLLSDKVYRKKVIAKMKDPLVRSFWIDEFSKYPDKFASEAIAPIQNKVGQFLSQSLIRNIIGQTKSTIDLRDIMDNRKILLMNLSKGRIGEDSSSMLGAMMITKIQLAAMERIDTLEESREDFYLYVDEFQNFATEAFATILSEARKYRLNLIMAHQYIEQLDETVVGAVFGNVGTIISFRIGATDAEVLAKEFAPQITEEDLVSLSKYQFYIKLMIDGVSSTPFSAQTISPEEYPLENNSEKIIQVTRERYSVKRDIIEDKIMRWTGAVDDDEEENSESGGGKREVEGKKKDKPAGDGKEVHAVCDNCGNETIISFEPDGVRPVFCKECLKLPKEDRDKIKPKLQEVSNETAPEAASLSAAIETSTVSFSNKTSRHRKQADTTPAEASLSPNTEIKLNH